MASRLDVMQRDGVPVAVDREVDWLPVPAVEVTELPLPELVERPGTTDRPVARPRQPNLGNSSTELCPTLTGSALQLGVMTPRKGSDEQRSSSSRACRRLDRDVWIIELGGVIAPGLLKAQSSSVETVSGAPYTSQAFQKSPQPALAKV